MTTWHRFDSAARCHGRHRRATHRRVWNRGVRASGRDGSRRGRPGKRLGRDRGTGAEAMSDGTPVLQIRGLTCNFGGLTAVDRVDVDVNRGEIVSLVGANGPGKTTVFNLTAGIPKPIAGSVQLLGRKLVRQ